MRRSLLVVFLFFVFAAPAQAGGPTMLLGANEAVFKQHTLVGAKASLGLAKLAGFQAVKVSEFWYPGMTEPPASDLGRLGNLAKAARLLGMPVYLSITNTFGRYAPKTDEDRAQFVQFAVKTVRTLPTFRKIVIGNEPNLNNFWAPQFDVDGSNMAARTYERVLAQTYDALKGVSRKIIVLGGAVSPRGHDDPNASSKSHSPTVFIRDLGRIYRASGRNRPIMDWFAFHPYQPNSSEPPSTRHAGTSITIGDYDKLVAVLGEAFDGTKQRGSKIPIVYDEYGLESTIPANKRRKYTGVEPKSTKPIPPALQGERYREAIQLAFCQPTVRAMFLFHAFDEPDLNRWQSGLFYVDKTPKASLKTVRKAFQEVRRGIAARCPGLRLGVKAIVKFLSPGKAASAGKRGTSIRFSVRCNLDCDYTSGVIELASGRSILAKLGRAIGRKKTIVRLPARKLEPGRYRVSVSLVAAVNPGRASRKASRPFSVR